MATTDLIRIKRKPTAERPLLGLTILIVEDSRYAAEALRLMSLRSGARIRRADSIAAARRHLAVYQPDVAIVDMGLPDGTGVDLISDMNTQDPRVLTILGTSAETGFSEACTKAGANGFISKPLGSLAEFQQAVLQTLPSGSQPSGLRVVNEATMEPDLMALRDDLVHIENVIEQTNSTPDNRTFAYAAQFLSSLAKSSGQAPLAIAAQRLAKIRAEDPSRRDATQQVSKVITGVLADHPMVI